MDTVGDLMPDAELHVLGQLDAHSLRHLPLALDEVVALRPEHLIIDLRRCTGLGTAAIALLERTQESLAEQGGVLVLRGPNPEVMRTLIRSGLLDRVEIDLPLVPSSEDAR